MQYYKNFELKKFNSFGLDSIAKEIWFPSSVIELQSVLKKIQNEKFYILSGGTNVLLPNKIDKVVCLRNCFRPKVAIIANNVYATAGVLTSLFIKRINDAEISGVEGLVGMPGFLGGAIAMNSGSGKYCISDYLTSVWVMNYKGLIYKYDKKDLRFGRRYSSLQNSKEIIIGAGFEFKDGKISKETIENTIKHRTSMPKYKSAGGIFVNWHCLKQNIDKIVGLEEGGATVSKSVNIITNTDNATFDDVYTLIKKIRCLVIEDLILEVKIFGELE